jgi:hypothetical protein
LISEDTKASKPPEIADSKKSPPLPEHTSTVLISLPPSTYLTHPPKVALICSANCSAETEEI